MELDFRVVWRAIGYQAVHGFCVHFRSIPQRGGVKCLFFQHDIKLFTIHEHGAWSFI